MNKIYNKALSEDLIFQINLTLDQIGEIEDYEVLVPPQSINLLEKFKSEIIYQCPWIEWNSTTYIVIRTVTDKGTRAAQCYHFDNYKTTAVLVLKSIEGDENGDLLVRNNLRREHGIGLYMLTKIFWTNPIAWFFLRIPVVRNKFFERIALKSRDVIVFNGETTYHGNLPINSQGVRRSILIHNNPLYYNSLITRLFHKLNTIYLHKNK
jgi:hypothetical protein